MERNSNASRTNTVLLLFLSAGLAAGVGVLGWLGKETYGEIRSTHDAVLTIKTEFSLQISDIRTRLAAVEVEIQKLKEKKP